MSTLTLFKPHYVILKFKLSLFDQNTLNAKVLEVFLFLNECQVVEFVRFLESDSSFKETTSKFDDFHHFSHLLKLSLNCSFSEEIWEALIIFPPFDRLKNSVYTVSLECKCGICSYLSFTLINLLQLVSNFSIHCFKLLIHMKSLKALLTFILLVVTFLYVQLVQKLFSLIPHLLGLGRNQSLILVKVLHTLIKDTKFVSWTILRALF